MTIHTIARSRQSLSCVVIEENIGLSDSEINSKQTELKELGLKEFLSKEQIEDIEGNLKTQVADYDLEELILATDYYLKHDAFIVAKYA